MDMKHTVAIPFKNRFVYNERGAPVWWDWCFDTFGNPNNSEYGIPASEHYWRLEPSGAAIWFAKPEHATLFALRWS